MDYPYLNTTVKLHDLNVKNCMAIVVKRKKRGPLAVMDDNKDQFFENSVFQNNCGSLSKVDHI